MEPPLTLRVQREVVIIRYNHSIMNDRRCLSILYSYVDLRLTADILGDAALGDAGCDTSYFYFRGKDGPWERTLKSCDSFKLISNLGKDRILSHQDIKDITEFVRRFVYCGGNGEDLVSTKVRMYQEQKVKRSSSLPPDAESMQFDVLRKHHRTYVWLRNLEPIIDALPFNQYG